jgi:aspartate-semialdehyde dehydrogenase
MDKIRVALLGSTGMVGQKMVLLLHKHPYFELSIVSASNENAGKKYEEAVKWIESSEIPESVAEMKLVKARAEDIKGAELVLSALPNEVAEKVELDMVREGFNVISNASPFREEKDIPLINPEVNWDHLKVLRKQRERRGWKGLLIKNPNCTAAILTLTFKPLMGLKIKQLIVTTLQSVSGAGYQGVPFMKIQDNIIPFIKNEEEKVENESRKMLGKEKNGIIEPEELIINATTTRVPVKVGHMGIVNVFTEEEVKEEELSESIGKFKSLPQELKLPTAPKKPIYIFKEKDRPQPMLDSNLEGGMAVAVGRISSKGRTVRYVVLGNNLVRGAAGITVLTAELFKNIYENTNL